MLAKNAKSWNKVTSKTAELLFFSLLVSRWYQQTGPWVQLCNLSVSVVLRITTMSTLVGCNLLNFKVWSPSPRNQENDTPYPPPPRTSLPKLGNDVVCKFCEFTPTDTGYVEPGKPTRGGRCSSASSSRTCSSAATVRAPCTTRRCSRREAASAAGWRELARSGKLDRARSQLYRSEILQENMRLTALFKLYKICILLHRCNLKIFAKKRFEKTAIFVKFQQKICKCRKN